MTPRSFYRGGLALLVLGSAAASCARLRDLPIFGDEAIFLRLARLLREDPAAHLWISLRAAAAPLHTWLLAAAQTPSADPVWAGRAVSVALGVATIPVIAWTVRRAVAAFGKVGASASASAFEAAALLALSPFFFFSRRIARVDAVFALETILVAGASLALAIEIRERPGRRILSAGVCFGALMGIVMLTRSAVSYAFWLLPVIAVLLWPTRKPGAAPRTAFCLGASLLVGAVLLAPYLLVAAPVDRTTRLFHLSATRPRIPLSARADLVLANARIAADAFWTYLSPPVVIGAVAAFLLLAGAGRWRLLGYLAAWEAVALLPAVVFAAEYFPRYALPAAAPVLATVAIGFEELRSRFSGRGPALARTGLLGALAVIVSLWSGLESARFLADWRSAPWMPVDRWQFVSGWPAGAATEGAVRFLSGRAAARPSLLLTPEISGNPTDAIWLLLGGRPGIDLAFAFEALRAPLRYPSPEQGARWLVREDLLRGGSTRTIAAGDPRPVLFVSPDPILTLEGWQSAEPYFRRRNPGLARLARFENPPPSPERRPTDAVVVLELR